MTLKSGIFSIFSILTCVGALTLSLVSTAVNSDVASTITPIATSVPNNTATPQSDKNLLITDALQEAGENCHLPCFLGFQPGETTVSSAVTYLEKTGFSSSWELSPDRKSYPTLEDYLRDSGRFIFGFLGEDKTNTGYLAVSFVAQGQLINRIDIQSADLDWLKGVRWIDLPTLVSETPYTPEIYIAPFAKMTDYSVFLIYQEINTLVVYDFDFSGDAESNTARLPLCFDIEHTRNIQIFIEGLDNQMTSTDPIYLKKVGFETFKDSYSIDTKTLIKFFADHPDTCLDPSQYKNT
jgi:hypothetical protein